MSTTDNLFTIALYLLSSMVQADAAILAFGAIFIIYKLQGLSSRYDFAVAFCISQDPDNVANILVAVDNNDKIAFVKAFAAARKSRSPEYGTTRNFLNYLERLWTIPNLQVVTKRSLRPSLFIVGFHTCACAILLLFMAKFGHIPWREKLSVFWVVGGPLVGLFCLGITLVCMVAWKVVVPEERLSLKKVNPELCRLAYEDAPVETRT